MKQSIKVLNETNKDVTQKECLGSIKLIKKHCNTFRERVKFRPRTVFSLENSFEA